MEKDQAPGRQAFGDYVLNKIYSMRSLISKLDLATLSSVGISARLADNLLEAWAKVGSAAANHEKAGNTSLPDPSTAIIKDYILSIVSAVSATVHASGGGGPLHSAVFMPDPVHASNVVYPDAHIVVRVVYDPTNVAFATALHGRLKTAFEVLFRYRKYGGAIIDIRLEKVAQMSEARGLMAWPKP